MDLIPLAETLINIPSITGEEAACAEWIETYCTNLGWIVERQYVTADRWNVFVNWKDNTDVVFCTHLDTVPPFLPASTHDGLLYGRGACDTKGIIAAMLTAGVRLHARGFIPAFLFVPGEERDSIGAKTAATTGRTASYIIVGEPTENQLAVGHKGALSYTLVTAGHSAHSAYPDKGSSAIHLLLDILRDLQAADWGTDEVLGPSTWNVGLIEGGIAPNVFADSARATMMHRIVDDLDLRKLQVTEIVRDRAEITFHAANGPQRMYVPQGFPTTTVAFGTDVPYVRALGTPLLVGPGSIHQAHTDHEHVSIAALDHAVSLYERLFEVLTHEHQ